MTIQAKIETLAHEQAGQLPMATGLPVELWSEFAGTART